MKAAELPAFTAEAESALILKPSSLGDIVHTLPAAYALHEKYPHLHLRWVANTEWAPLLSQIPWVHEVIPFPRAQFRGISALLRAQSWARKTLKKHPSLGAEIVLDFQGLLRSALLAKASGSRPIVGLSDSREGACFWHDVRVPTQKDVHAVERYFSLVQSLGADPTAEHLRFPMQPAELPPDWPQGAGEQPIILHPWSRGAGKSLHPACIQALCESLAPHAVALVGLSESSWRPTGSHVLDFSNRTSLPQLWTCLKKAKFVISVDSGPMHMAAAVNDQLLALHTWSDPRRVGPYHPEAWVWKSGRIAHRTDFNPEEAKKDAEIAIEDARLVGEFVQRRL